MSKGYTLPADVTRCHDSECPRHSTCVRWVQRALPEGRLVWQHRSLRDGGSCNHYREIEVGYAGYPGDKT